MKFLHCLSFLLILSCLTAVRAGAETLEIENEIVRVETLSGTTVLVSGRSELHLTGDVADPFPGSEIHLNSEDSWLFLSRVRPASVNSGVLNRILVNGATASAGQNVRVVQYAQGSVIIPHGPGFAALTLFREPHFEGGSTPIAADAFFNTSTDGLNFGRFNWNQSVSSFILRRGYMATFAENMDGTGASRVYIAQDGDLEVARLPEELDNNTRFLRVVPWRWVTQKGWSGGHSEAAMVNSSWRYDWDNVATSTSNIEYVPMRHNANWNAYSNINNKVGSTHALGFNEPDRPDQANMTVGQALGQWNNFMASGLRIGSPAPSDADSGLNWLYSFMDQADALDYRVDYVAVHYYKNNWTAGQIQNWLRGIYERTGRPIWVTEWNNGCNWTQPHPTLQQNAAKIQELAAAMAALPFVERYAIYQWCTNRELVISGNLTPAGEVYRDFDAPIAFLQDFPGGVGANANYAFDSNVRDSGEHGNHAMIVGSPDFVPGVIGDSIRFDGELDYLQLPENVGTSEAFTFAAWVKWDGGGNWQRIFDFGDANNQYLFLTPRSGAGTLRFNIRHRDTQQQLNADPLVPGEWTHVAVTMGRGGARLYVNGESVASTGGQLRPFDLRTRYHYIGRSQAQYPDPFFAGQLDDVHILDRALTPAEIAELATPPEPALSYSAWADEIDFPPGLSGLQDDPDGDGIPNGLEFLLGSDPLAPSSGRLPAAEFVPGSDLGPDADPEKTYLSLRVRVLKDRTGVALTPRAAPALEDLATPEAADNVREAAPPVDDGDFEIRTFFYTVPIEDSPTGRAFMRLQVTTD